MSATLNSRFDEASDARLLALWTRGTPSSEIALQLGRTRASVISRARKLGVPHPNGVPHPRKRVIWADGPLADGTPPRLSPEEYRARHLAARAEVEAHIDSLRVNRDPCPKCAVRADIGCKHRRAA